jgi:4-amino-4-deoxy-L-arabinose transferase-like glycosyltransferase
VCLRVSTILLSWLGLWAFFDLLCGEGASPAGAGWATAALAFNPLFFLLQGTFMTDVPALSFCLCALALYSRAVKRRRFFLLVLAFLIACLAVTTRQNTIVVPLIAALLLAGSAELRRRPAWWLGALGPALFAALTYWWQAQRADVPVIPMALGTWDVELRYAFVALTYVGFAAAPLALWGTTGCPRRLWFWSLALVSAAAWFYYDHDSGLPFGGLFPYSANIITPAGAFSDLWYLDSRPELLSKPIRIGLTVLVVVGASGFLVAMWRERKITLTLWLAILQFPLLLVGPLFDRYMIFLMPGTLSTLCPSRPNRIGRLFGISILTLFAIASIGLMHDWLAWQSARWDLARWAVENLHISATAIEGGVEWDGDHEPQPDLHPATRRTRSFASNATQWFPSISGDYGIANNDRPRTRHLAARHYVTWLPPAHRSVYLLAAGKR